MDQAGPTVDLGKTSWYLTDQLRTSPGPCILTHAVNTNLNTGVARSDPNVSEVTRMVRYKSSSHGNLRQYSATSGSVNIVSVLIIRANSGLEANPLEGDTGPSLYMKTEIGRILCR